MTSSYNFPDRDSSAAMDPTMYALWAQANAAAGYRYSVDAQPGSQSLQGKTATISVVWTNYGSAAATEQWAPGYKLVDFSGAAVRTLPAAVNLRSLVHDDSSQSRGEVVPATSTEIRSCRPVRAGAGALHVARLGRLATAQAGGIARGELSAHGAGRDGRDESGLYPIATLDIPRDNQTPGNSQ